MKRLPSFPWHAYALESVYLDHIESFNRLLLYFSQMMVALLQLPGVTSHTMELGDVIYCGTSLCISSKDLNKTDILGITTAYDQLIVAIKNQGTALSRMRP